MPPSATSSPDLLTTLKPARKLSLLTQNSPLAIIEWDSNLVVQGWNPAAAELFNFFEDEAIGQPLDELLAERQIVDLGSEDWQSCEPTGVLRSHANMTGKKVCRWYNTPLCVKGQRIGTMATIIDVSHRTELTNEELRAQLQSRTRVLKHTTERLQKAMNERTQTDATLIASQSRFDALMARVPGILYQFRLSADLTPSFSFISPSSKTLLELSPQQICSDASLLIERIHPDDKADFDQSVALSAQNLTDWHWHGRFVLFSGRTVWMQAASRPEKQHDGSIVWDGLLMDITDNKASESALQRSESKLRSQTQQLKSAITQLRRTQAKLIQSEKMSSLGQLVAGIAHELNNPVNFIHGNLTHAQAYIQDILKIIRLYQAHYPAPIPEVQTVSSELELDYVLSDLPKLLQSVQAGTNRIRQIVLSLRNFSRLDESELKSIDIHEGLESTLMILGNRLKATGERRAIKIIKAYEKIPPVDCYAGQLNQVFMNILVNAIDAIDDADDADKANKIYQIVLQTFQENNRVVVQITNNGPPIPKEVSRRLFDPFFTTKPVGQGTGMGLAVSYQTVVDLHKGTLEYSQTDDQKTSFKIEIPSAPPPESSSVTRA